VLFVPKVLVLSFSAVLVVTACSGQNQSPTSVDRAPASPQAESLISNELIGNWDVALYFDPNSPPSATELVITSVKDDGSLEGSFYQSSFEIGRFTQKDGALIISVVTSDGSGPYSTSGRLYADGRFEGQTLSTGRGFLMPWTATRRD